MSKSSALKRGGRAASVLMALTILAAVTSSGISIAFLLRGLIYEGPAFYNGDECRMTYSQFQFLPLRVLPPSLSSSPSTKSSAPPEGRYRLLKFTDARDPRHQHFYPISGSMVENYESQSNPKRDSKKSGRVLELDDNWCLLSREDILESKNEDKKKWRDAPHPHRGHPVLYVPGHWGSFSQARSLGAHGTRWTGPYARATSDRQIYDSFWTGEGMHDGIGLLGDPSGSDTAYEDFMKWISSSYSKQQLDGFVMDVFALDFEGQGAALHSSKLLRQAEFFARSVETIIEGCNLPSNDNNAQAQKGITIVAHSIGAWVVRIALKMHPHLTRDGWIRNVITLASPLSSVPYAVDAGIHDIAKHINDDVHDEGNVTMISISGGLRDEMIPPEVCQVPAPTINGHNKVGEETVTGLVSNAFLASSIMQSSSPKAGDQFGMDHRAIVWCYDLLKVVREVIFSLAVATDQGLSPAERMKVAQKVMYGESSGVGSEPTSQGSNSYHEGVNAQHMRLLQEKGYSRAVSIQLSAPYHLNALLKLSIVAAMLHTIAIGPVLKRFQQGHTGLVEKGFNMAASLLTIPLLVVMVTWMRQSESLQACYGHECQLLLGSIYILSQLATAIYFIIVCGVCPLVAAICRKCSNPSNNSGSQQSFRGIFVHVCMQQLRNLVLVMLPLTGAVCYTINTFILGNNDHIWNTTTTASCCFISFLLLTFTNLVTLACKPSPVNFEQQRSELLIFFLSLLKATFGKALYAFSLTTKWGQSDLGSYDDFLSATNSSTGVICGHHHEMIICVVSMLLPVFFAATAIKSYCIMSENSACYWNEANRVDGDGDIANGKSNNLPSLENVMPKYNESVIILILRACFTCWFTWNVLENFPADNLIVRFYSAIGFVTAYLRCRPHSLDVVDVCSAIIKNDLSLKCDSLKNHDKNE